MKLTVEQIKMMKAVYQSNKEELEKVEAYIRENGVTDSGVADPTESFEQGWNNAMEYVFRVLDIKSMSVEELKCHENYEFECNMTDEYKDIETDEWGCAFVWYGDDLGVEYNFCIDSGENCCAIYKTEINKKTGYTETDYDKYTHYEIDFNNDNWKEELENAMCEALIKFHNL